MTDIGSGGAPGHPHGGPGPWGPPDQPQAAWAPQPGGAQPGSAQSDSAQPGSPHQATAPYGSPHGGPQYAGPQYAGPQHPQQYGQQYGSPQPGPQHAQRYGSPYGGPAGPQTAVLGGPPPAWPPPGANPPPRRRWPIVAAVLAVLALAAGAVTVVTLLGGRGGAPTSREAVQLLATDLADREYLRAVSRLHPSEAALLQDLGTVVTDELVRLEVLRPGSDLTSGLGSVTISDLRFDEASAEQVRDDVVITKVVGGRITLGQDPAALPFTDSFRTLAFPDGVPAASRDTTIDLAEVVADQGEPVRLATVRVDGSWYVSLSYTAADYALRSEGLAWPRTSIAARGAASAEDALRQTVQAALDGDVRRLVELAPPGELQVVHDLGDVIVENAEAERSGARLVDLRTTETTVRGGTALAVDAVSVEVDGERVDVTRSGDCLEVRATDGSNERVCGADDFIQQTGIDVDDPVAARVVPKLVGAALELKIAVVQEDGEWFVSPSRTLVGVYADLLGALTAEDVADLVRASR